MINTITGHMSTEDDSFTGSLAARLCINTMFDAGTPTEVVAKRAELTISTVELAYASYLSALLHEFVTSPGGTIELRDGDLDDTCVRAHISVEGAYEGDLVEGYTLAALGMSPAPFSRYPDGQPVLRG